MLRCSVTPVQGLLDNSRGKSAKDLLSKCKQQVPSDNMVAFLRAITAKGFMDKGEQYLAWVQDHTGCVG